RAGSPRLDHRGERDFLPRVGPRFELTQYFKHQSSPGRNAAVEAGKEAPEVIERLHVMRGQEVVAVRKRRRHPSRQGLITLRAQQGVEPDEPVRGAAKVDEL